MAGICSYGGYVPRYRLNRGIMFGAMGWVNAANIANARGERAVANFDEDSITMAVAAGIDALGGVDRSQVGGVYFASSTLPYKERLNAGIVSSALGLEDQVRAADFTGGLKAVERTLGIVRNERIADVDGYEAVRLWRAHRRGDPGALATLIEYNRADTLNLARIAPVIYERLCRKGSGSASA